MAQDRGYAAREWDAGEDYRRCLFCDEQHPGGVPKTAENAGHPVAADRGRGVEYVRVNPETGAAERWSFAAKTFVPDYPTAGQ